jgi:hypothetical protein
MPRYIYDHCEIGSRHDGGLGSHDSLDEAMRRAAQGVGRHGPDVYASVYDTVTGRHLEVRRRAIDGDPVLTPRRCLTLLREQAATDGWSLPAHRPRRDPAAARVNLVCRVHPDTRARFDAFRQLTGQGLGELLDTLANALPLNTEPIPKPKPERITVSAVFSPMRPISMDASSPSESSGDSQRKA